MDQLPFELLCEIFHKIPRGWALESNARGCPQASRFLYLSFRSDGIGASLPFPERSRYPKLWRTIVIPNPKKSQTYLTVVEKSRSGPARSHDLYAQRRQHIRRTCNTGEKLTCNCHLTLWPIYVLPTPDYVKNGNPPNSCLQWMIPIRYSPVNLNGSYFMICTAKYGDSFFDLARCAELVVQVAHKRLSWQMYDATNWLRSLVSCRLSSKTS